MSEPHPVEIAFFKMEGSGNDYVYLDMDLFQAGHQTFVEEHVKDLACKIADRHFGVGGDGLVLVSREGDIDGRMKMYNADGSESGICGNALRCVAKYLAECGENPAESIDIHTGSGIKHCELQWTEDEITQVRADMGTPIFAAADVPFDEKALPEGAKARDTEADSAIAVEIPLGKARVPGYVLSMGNPHLVLFVDRDPGDYDLAALAAPLESASMFPDRANIEFVQDLGQGRVRQRTFERGSGETLACGSGACAVGVAAVHHGLLPRGDLLQVELRGGTLQIEWSLTGSVFMTGPATHVFEGVYRYRH